VIVVACIPARYGSTRFPAKVLANDTGKFLIEHTYERACAAKLVEKVIIATDDEKVMEAAKSFGAECVMTSPDHNSGTDRIAEAVGPVDADIVVNLQADEPEIDPDNIDYVARLLVENTDYPMATLSADFERAEQITDPNIVKVITLRSEGRTRDEGRGTKADVGRAIYFSRSPIPYDRDAAGIGQLDQYKRHLGIYAYRKEFLLKITALPQTPLEKTEKLEQLRAIENGFGILVGTVEHTCDGIDTPEQYTAFVKRQGLKKGER
jgi:3-deoxy-manno-octulosonate cytidylyltransferase (CMP-KDO synthetase)